MAPAYDYKAQRWVEEPEAARRLHIEHLEDEIALLSRDKAFVQRYLTNLGYSETPTEALTMAKAKLATYH